MQRNFNLSYKNITSVEKMQFLGSDSIMINAGSKKYTIPLDSGVDEAYRIINEKMNTI